MPPFATSANGSVGKVEDHRAGEIVRAGERHRTNPTRPDLASRIDVPEDERDGEAVELGVRGLSHDVLEDLAFRVGSNPIGDCLAERLAIADLGRREHLQAKPGVVIHAA